MAKPFKFGVFLLATPLVGLLALAEDAEVPDEWEFALRGLRDSDFVARERAAAQLADQPPEALEWLRERLAETPEDDDPEFRMRLASIIGEMKGREARADLERGLEVSLDLDKAGPEAVLAALEEAVPRRLVADSVQTIWGEVDEAGFAAGGSYWDVVDAFFKAFPPKVAEKPGREEITKSTHLARFDLADVAAVSQPHATDGVLRLRVARTALEHSNGTDYLALTLVPKVVPAYLTEELSLLVKSVETGDGTKLVPEELPRTFTRSGRYQGATFEPGDLFTWALPIERGTAVRGPLRLEVEAKIELRRMDWEQRKLPALNHSVAFGEGITLSLEQKAAGSLKVKFSGSSKMRYDFHGYPRNGQKRLFDLLDADGEPVSFRMQGASSGGGEPWYYSFNCRFEEDREVAIVKALVPGELLTTRSELVLEGLRVPGG